jgi:tetratricopeptide (TPR) repeat protein
MDQLAALEVAQDLVDPVDDRRPWYSLSGEIRNSLRYGPVPAPEAIERGDRLPRAEDGMQPVGVFKAPLLAMQDRFDEARQELRETRDYLRERAMKVRLGNTSLPGGAIEMLAGDFEAATRDFASGIAILSSFGETSVVSTLAAMQARALYHLGRREEMEAAIALAQETGATSDIATQAEWRSVAAMAAADDGRLDEAGRLIAEALEMVEPTDFLELRGGTFEALAHVEARAGRPAGWKAALERAVAEHDRKGNVVAARRVRDLIRRGPP